MIFFYQYTFSWPFQNKLYFWKLLIYWSEIVTYVFKGIDGCAGHGG